MDQSEYIGSLPPAGTSVVVVAGPTASGKSALALAIAERYGGTVINADSMQVYRELRILTARPSPEDEARVPHRLYGCISARDVCSAGRWRELAMAAIGEAAAAGRLPIVTGGTGLYLHALQHGLSPIPDVPEPVRAAARALHAGIGGLALHRLLVERDAATAEQLRPSDTQRLIRAWEVLEATGQGLAAWRRNVPPVEGLSFLPLVLLPPRPWLYARCDARLVHMIGQGALAEVAALDKLALRAFPARDEGPRGAGVPAPSRQRNFLDPGAHDGAAGHAEFRQTAGHLVSASDIASFSA